MRSLKLVLVSAILALASTGANAAWISVSGTTVDFSFDDSFLSPLFGTYTVSGDTLSFSPVGFEAFQNGSVGFDFGNATTPEIKVMAKSGFALTELSLFEQGDYLRLEDASGETAVSVAGQFIVNNNPTSITSTQPLNAAISSADFFNGVAALETTTWNAENSVLLNSVGYATAKVQNLLVAGVSNAGLNMAFIEKKLMNISADTVPVVVPAPGAVWLFGSAMAGFLVSRRKAVAI
jgi:hypothetical protein